MKRERNKEEGVGWVDKMSYLTERDLREMTLEGLLEEGEFEEARWYRENKLREVEQ